MVGTHFPVRARIRVLVRTRFISNYVEGRLTEGLRLKAEGPQEDCWEAAEVVRTRAYENQCNCTSAKIAEILV